MDKPSGSALATLVKSVGARISGVVLLVFALSVALAWSILPPPLPEVVRFGTGPTDGSYTRFGGSLRSEFNALGIDLELVTTAGSRENVERLLAGEVDIALVQSGVMSDSEAENLVSIAAVMYEPVLVVHRAEWESDHVKGGRIAIGAARSGTNALARTLLRDQGIREGVPPGTEFVEIGGERAVAGLVAGEFDTAIFVSAIELPWVRTLFTDPNLRVTEFDTARAFTRHYRYLRQMVIPAGLIDLETVVPANDLEIIATTASLVARPDIDRALIPLVVEGSREMLLQGGLLAAPGVFPSPLGVEAPLADDALHYFEHGPSFLYRWLPFRYAYGATRLIIILLPLLTLLYPLLRSIGPAYRWVNHRRVYRWYRVLQRLEERIDACANAEEIRGIERDLEQVDDEIRAVHVPSRFGANLFALRTHQKLLVERVESLKAASARENPGTNR